MQINNSNMKCIDCSLELINLAEVITLPPACGVKFSVLHELSLCSVWTNQTHKSIIIFNEESNKLTLPTKFYEISPTNEAYPLAPTNLVCCYRTQ